MSKDGQSAMKYIETLRRHMAGEAGGAHLLAHWFTRGMTRSVEQRGMEPDPLLLILAEDVLAHCLLVRQAYEALRPRSGSVPPPDVPPPTAPGCNGRRRAAAAVDAMAPDDKAAPALLDNVVKYREKLRKSVGDLQAMLASHGAPAPTGLAALFPEIDAHLEGVMSAAEAYRQLDPTPAPAHPGRPLKGVRRDLQAVAPGRPEYAGLTAEPGGSTGAASAESAQGEE